MCDYTRRLLRDNQFKVLEKLGYNYSKDNGMEYFLKDDKRISANHLRSEVEIQFGSSLTIYKNGFVLTEKETMVPTNIIFVEDPLGLYGSIEFNTDYDIPSLYFKGEIKKAGGQQKELNSKGSMCLYYETKKGSKTKKQQRKRVGFELTAEGIIYFKDDNREMIMPLGTLSTENIMKYFQEYFNNMHEDLYGNNLGSDIKNSIYRFLDCIETYVESLLVAFYEDIENLRNHCIKKMDINKEPIDNLNYWYNYSPIGLAQHTSDNSWILHGNENYANTNISNYTRQILRYLGVSILPRIPNSFNKDSKDLQVYYKGQRLEPESNGIETSYYDKEKRKVISTYSTYGGVNFGPYNGIKLSMGLYSYPGPKEINGQNYVLSFNGESFYIEGEVYDSPLKKADSLSLGWIKLTAINKKHMRKSIAIEQLGTCAKVSKNKLSDDSIEYLPFNQCDYANYIALFKELINNLVSEGFFENNENECDIEYVKTIALQIIDLYLRNLLVSYRANMKLLQHFYTSEASQRQQIIDQFVATEQAKVDQMREKAEIIGQALTLHRKGSS